MELPTQFTTSTCRTCEHNIEDGRVAVVYRSCAQAWIRGRSPRGGGGLQSICFLLPCFRGEQDAVGGKTT